VVLSVLGFLKYDAFIAGTVIDMLALILKIFDDKSAESRCTHCMNVLCRVCCTGFKTYLAHSLLPRSSQPADTNLISRPRITTSPEFLCELLHGIYFVMYVVVMSPNIATCINSQRDLLHSNI